MPEFSQRNTAYRREAAIIPAWKVGEREAKYSERNAGAYPGFAVFSTVTQYQARTKNDPNILIGAKLAPVGTPAPSRRVQNRRGLATNTQSISMNPRPSLREVETIAPVI